MFPKTYNGENVVQKIAPSFFIKSSSNLQVTGTAGNKDTHNILDEFDCGTDRTIHFGVTCPTRSGPIFVRNIACLVLI